MKEQEKILLGIMIEVNDEYNYESYRKCVKRKILI
jgi:hypothetical protein